jgi:hypothetical protein
MDSFLSIIAAFIAGGVGALLTCGFVYTYLYEQITHLQMQVLALRVELNKEYDRNDLN